MKQLLTSENNLETLRRHRSEMKTAELTCTLTWSPLESSTAQHSTAADWVLRRETSKEWVLYCKLVSDWNCVCASLWAGVRGNGERLVIGRSRVWLSLCTKSRTSLYVCLFPTCLILSAGWRNVLWLHVHCCITCVSLVSLYNIYICRTFSSVYMWWAPLLPHSSQLCSPHTDQRSEVDPH